jgi:hypothetical protein
LSVSCHLFMHSHERTQNNQHCWRARKKCSSSITDIFLRQLQLNCVFFYLKHALSLQDAIREVVCEINFMSFNFKCNKMAVIVSIKLWCVCKWFSEW